ncbi:MAG: four helix bundle protein [Candidatus Magasanikbacteria bacterium CG11_big_fil_rev_8_21_14_0_20_43_7]|uniref:Four helix bundle protein n=1 Tax=Candidatus Magasanikbacteria bacterium CG11_big_fil_rev_8_21_14_0_20_43_7 TaxID=1974654 RepID=A0A2H0N576_9BACT|nr:MAG: four helix bundle protein [Candidatus Magasanikbacteria bacterium CG11_big_fil_rev_8_21_14_0_20_43_7]
MGGYYKFEKLETWKRAREFLKVVYIISKDFPDDERFGLTSQMRRATLSIVLNIAEGSQRNSDKDFVRFLQISYGSLLEVVSCCYTAKDLGYLSEERFSFIYNKSHIVAKKINSLKKTLTK